MIETVRLSVARRALITALGLALVASLSPMIAGEAFAGKPIPVIGAHGAKCIEAIGSQAEEHVAWFDLGPNKGRWIFIKAEIKLGGDDWASYVGDGHHRVETGLYEMRATGMADGAASGFRVQVVSRKGATLTGWTEHIDVDCL
ncbi:MAG: hypothetical protein ACR2OH_05310 [Microthrixaceae bacterium]